MLFSLDGVAPDGRFSLVGEVSGTVRKTESAGSP